MIDHQDLYTNRAWKTKESTGFRSRKILCYQVLLVKPWYCYLIDDNMCVYGRTCTCSQGNVFCHPREPVSCIPYPVSRNYTCTRRTWIGNLGKISYHSLYIVHSHNDQPKKYFNFIKSSNHEGSSTIVTPLENWILNCYLLGSIEIKILIGWEGACHLT